MKRKFKRVSKRTLSVILAIMMALSTMFVGIVSVDAANNGDNLYVYYGTESQFTTVSSKPMTYSSNLYTTVIDFTDVAGWIWYVLSISSSASDRSVCWDSRPTITNNTQKITNLEFQNRDGYNNVVHFETKGDAPAGTSDLVKVTYDITANTITFDPGDSEPPTEPTTEPTTTSPTDPTDHVAKWALNGNFSTDTSNNTGWNTNFSAAKLVGAYESSFATGEVFSVSLELDSAKYFRLIKKDDSNNEYRPVGSGNSVDHDLIEKGNNSQESACNTEIGSDGAFYLPEGSYTLYVDQSGATPKVWCTIDGGSDLTPGAIKLKDDTAVNGSLSFKAEGNTSGTADIDKNVTITAKPFAGFTCSKITVSYTKPVAAPDAVPEKVTEDLTVTDNTATFAVPDVQPNKNNEKEISFAASFTLDKKAYLDSKGDGLWIDVAPDKEDTTATLIKWNNYYGNNHATSNPYTFYVPKNVDLSQAVIYNAYNDAVTLNGTNIPAHGKVKINLNAGEYTATGACGNQTVKVMQGSTNAMFLYTTDKNGGYDLPTQIYDSRIKPINPIENEYDKESIKATGGNCTTMTDNGVSAALKLSQVKGRGNSSWGASTVLFGKYAYNMKLDSATALFDLPKSKSFCLLANNADESMLRNAFIYQLADNIGLYDSPEFRFVDIYDNGEYMGQYLITEKVDVADKNKLVLGNSIDDLNEDAGAEFYEDKEYWKREDDIGYAEISNGVDLDNNADFVNKYQTTGTYLLEFEIPKRVDAEVSFFKSNQGQDVVLKSPEFATKGEVEFIKNKFNSMENLVYNNASLEELNKVMDLDSFAKMYLIQEFSSNLDAAATSYYITYNCAEGRFVASPVWDYDWALGQYETNNYNAKHDVDGNILYTQNAVGWFAKNKAMGDGADTRKYSLQSRLANNSNFLPVIKKVWTNSFYEEVQKYYEDGGQIDQWYNQISSSVAMNEARWGFIKSNLATGWGSKDTGENHQAAVNYLKNDWSRNRTESLNGNQYINSYQDYTQFAIPTLKAYNADGEEISSDVEAGSEIVLKATTPETYVKFKFYDGDSLLGESDKNQYTIASASAGNHNYRVETVYGSSNTMVSNDVTVTVNSVDIPVLERVSLRASADSITTGSSVTLTATPTPGDIEGCTYTFYHSTDNSNYTLFGQASTSNKATETLNEAGTYYYYVEATKDGKTVKSQTISVTVTEPISGTHDVTVYFKSASAFAYAPKVILNNGSEITMTKDQELGTIYSGALTIYWFKAVLTVDSKSTNTLIFKTNRTSLNSSIKGNFAGTEYYFAADNIMNGSEIVDLTSQPEYIRNYYHTPLHMVYSSYESDKKLGFTNIGGKMYQLGAEVDENGKIINSNATIDTVTTLQKSIVNLVDVSEVQNNLLDVNLDGSVDITDATMIQKVLAGI